VYFFIHTQKVSIYGTKVEVATFQYFFFLTRKSKKSKKEEEEEEEEETS
jgi:hypothetical protein